MAQKWTDEQKSKFKETMTRIYAEKRARKEEAARKLSERKAKYRAKAKKKPKSNGLVQRISPRDLPVIEVEIPNGAERDMQEFAAFMAAAWKVYKS
jgi:hypothetical protein